MNEELFPFLERKDLINGRFQELTENKALGLITGMGCRGCRQTLKALKQIGGLEKLNLKTFQVDINFALAALDTELGEQMISKPLSDNEQYLPILVYFEKGKYDRLIPNDNINNPDYFVGYMQTIVE